MSRKTPRKISKAEVRRTVEAGIEANDMVRVTELENLQRLRGKKVSLQQRERQRLSEKYGSNHRRVQQVNANLEANVNYIGGLRMEVTRAKTPMIEQDKNAWCVQGHVYDRQAIPIPNAKVALYSVDEKEIPRVAATTTDARGYYQLNYAPRGGTPADDETPDSGSDPVLPEADDSGAGSGLSINTGADTGGTGTGEPAIIERLDEGLRINTNTNARASVFVRAIDPQVPELCADSSLITPRAGVCSYRDISIDTNAFKPTDSRD